MENHEKPASVNQHDFKVPETNDTPPPIQSPSPPPPVAYLTCHPLQARSPLLRLSVLPQKRHPASARSAAGQTRQSSGRYCNLARSKSRFAALNIHLKTRRVIPKATRREAAVHHRAMSRTTTGLRSASDPQRRPSIAGAFFSFSRSYPSIVRSTCSRSRFRCSGSPDSRTASSPA